MEDQKPLVDSGIRENAFRKKFVTVLQAMAFTRALWRATLIVDAHVWSESTQKQLLIEAREVGLEEEDCELFRKLLVDHGLARQSSGLTVKLEYLFPPRMNQLVCSALREPDVRALTWRALRTEFGCTKSPALIRGIFLLCNAVHQRFLRDMEGNSNVVSYVELKQHLEDIVASVADQRQIVDLFLEASCIVGYIVAASRPGHIVFAASLFDPDFLLSSLFGLSTGMPGFDYLFFGGGLNLAEYLTGSNQKQRSHIGRVILIKGRFGTGKSLLATLLALEVARKDGYASITPLEENPEVYLQVVESMGGATVDVDNVPAIILDVAELDPMAGVFPSSTIVILRSPAKTKLSVLLASIGLLAKQGATEKNQAPLRLMVIDPMNSISGLVANPSVRRRVSHTLNELRSAGVNVILVAEESEPTTADSHAGFLSNVADTVIRLSIETRHSYAQRYIEIEKSRLQREDRGKHPFRIRAGQGIVIYPSSASVAAGLRRQHRYRVANDFSMGIAQLDRILGVGACKDNDVIVIRGDESTLKTPLGMLFLATSCRPRSSLSPGQDTVSLCLTARDSKESILELLKSSFVEKHRHQLREQKDGRLRANRTEVVEARHNFIQPGEVFEILDHVFEEQARLSCVVDRVLIDNIEHWEMSCPFIRDDETFIDTLVAYLKAKGVMTMLICGKVSTPGRSAIQDAVVESAEILLETKRILFRGTERSILHVQKTRGMRHRVESYDMQVDTADGLRIEPDSALLRFGTDGEIKHVRCMLYLHSETDIQLKYNESILQSLRPVLSRHVQLSSGNRTRLVEALPLAQFSTVDELQVLQLDEFQLPELFIDEGRSANLYVFPKSDWNDGTKNIAPWEDFQWVMNSTGPGRTGDYFSVIPLYLNFGLLAYHHRSEELSSKLEAARSDWTELARLCEEWERKPEHGSEVFFGYPNRTDEDYNCLFFEVARGFLKDRDIVMNGACGLRLWLFDDREVVRDDVLEASYIFRRLARRHHIRTGMPHRTAVLEHAALTQNPERMPDQTSSGAVIWRHWYSTLREWMNALPIEASQELRVRPVPLNRTVAGEWYLAIPSYSAAPAVGLKVMRLLAGKVEQLRRLRLGVGLPTEQSFYTGKHLDSENSPWLNMSSSMVVEAVKHALRRSHIGCYAKISSILAQHLRQIIEVPEPIAPNSIDLMDQPLQLRLRQIWASFFQAYQFVQENDVCAQCHGAQGKDAGQSA